MFPKICLLLCLFTLTSSSPQTKLRFPQYCTYMNYPVQPHIIHTDDNVNLKFFRIQAKNTTIQPNKKVVYLQHGLGDSSDTFIVNDQDKALGFVLANRGFDVWVGNTRGNRYSNKQISPAYKKFWDFDFDDIAKHDLTAAFKYINNRTSQKIHYIGHSQGTLIMFIALSMKYPNVQQNMLSFSALGPIAYLKNLSSKLLLDIMKLPLAQILYKSGDQIILYQSDRQLQLQSVFCKLNPGSCISLLSKISQKNVTVNNLARLPIIMAHYPAGTSVKNLIHFRQLTQTGQFKMFDYGKEGNLKKYGQEKAPQYNLANVSFGNVHLFVGKYDKLATVEDVRRLYKDLTNAGNKTYEELDFGHATFIWGKDVAFIEKLVNIIQQASKNENQGKLETFIQ